MTQNFVLRLDKPMTEQSFSITENQNRLSISHQHPTEESSQINRTVNDTLELSMDDQPLEDCKNKDLRRTNNQNSIQLNASLLQNLQENSQIQKKEAQSGLQNHVQSEELQIPEQIKKQAEERKRKRKEIFSKFTKKQTNKVLAGTGESSRLSALQSFDEIFSIRSPKRSIGGLGQAQPDKQLANQRNSLENSVQRSQTGPKSLHNLRSPLTSKNSDNHIVSETQFRSPQLQKYHSEPSNYKNAQQNSALQPHQELIQIAEDDFDQLPSGGQPCNGNSSKQSNEKGPESNEFKHQTQKESHSSESFNVFEQSALQRPPLQISTIKNSQTSVSSESPRSTHKSIDPNKISVIKPFPGEVSRDQEDVESILQSEIFEQEKLNHTIKQSDLSYKQIQISTLNPSCVMAIQTGNDLGKSEKSASEKNALSNFQDRFAPVIESKQQGRLAQLSQPKQSPYKQNKKVDSPFEQLPNATIQGEQLEKSCKQKPTLPQIVLQSPEGYSQDRIPPFLREVRRLNTILPNFNVNKLSPETCFEYLNQFKQLVKEFEKVVQFLGSCNDNISLHMQFVREIDHKLVNCLTVQNFVTSNWEKAVKRQNLDSVLDQIRPRQNFIKRDYSFAKIKQALKNYSDIVDYYQKITINIMQKKAQVKYLEVRNKFWQIQKNLKMIAEDLYMASVEVTLPPHYFEYLYVLKGMRNQSKAKSSSEKASYLRKVLGTQYRLKAQGDILSMSEVGLKVRQVAERQLHRTVYV